MRWRGEATHLFLKSNLEMVDFFLEKDSCGGVKGGVGAVGRA
jgi:hypothetical protein